MAYFNSHHIFGKLVAARLHDIGIFPEEELFNWGQQSADLFYYRKSPFSTRSLNRFGRLVHHNAVGEVFAAAGEFILAKPENRELLPYFYGMLCHYALDSTIHPYVYAVQDMMEEQGKLSAHRHIEACVDGALRAGAPRNPFPNLSRDYCLCKRKQLLLARLWSYILEKVFDESLCPAKILPAFSETLMLQYGIRYGAPFLRPAASFAETVLDKEYALSSSFIYHDKSFDALNSRRRVTYVSRRGARVNQNVRELFQEAEDYALELIASASEFLHNGKAPELSFSLDYSARPLTSQE